MSFPLFKGATRAPAVWAIPYPVFIGTCVAFIVIGLVSTKPFLFLLSIPVLVIEHFIAITDPNAFRIWALHIKLNIRRKIIKGSDSFYSQFNYRGDRK